MDGTGRAEPFYALADELSHLDLHEPRPIHARPREPVIATQTKSNETSGWLALLLVDRIARFTAVT